MVRIPPNNSLGKAIRLIRRAKNMSQTDLRSKTGLETGYISRIENGWVIPREGILEKLADAFGVCVAQIKIVEAIELEPRKYKGEDARKFLGKEFYGALYD